MGGLGCSQASVVGKDVVFCRPLAGRPGFDPQLGEDITWHQVSRRQPK